MSANKESAELKTAILETIKKNYGPRCRTKDTDDFDDLITVGNPDDGRCPVCLVYEKFDAFWRTLVGDDNL